MVLAQRIRWRQRRLCSLEFPSHYGSRSTKLPVLDTDVFVDRFHPTMVLAQQTGRTVIGLHVAVVSIPLWFSLNSAPRRLRRRTGCFHPTLVLAQLVHEEEFFDTDGKFPSHIGSRSTVNGSVELIAGPKFPSHIGSRSTETLFIAQDKLMFPSHIGSRSTTGRKVIVLAPSTFPSHSGSRSTRTFSRKSESSSFPSHIGSRSTSTRDAGTGKTRNSFHPTLVLAQRVHGTWRRRQDYEVSIPHWFSLNTTTATRSEPPSASFPSHIGSRSTASETRLRSGYRNVSIPHWFSLNSARVSALGTRWSFHPTLVLAQHKD